MQAYSNPKREQDPYSLPDLEVFWVGKSADDYTNCPICAEGFEPRTAHEDHVGYYWQSCLPGCLPDSEPNGPFSTQEEALADAREGLEDEEED